ncbi:hypothetical protein VNO78_13926 [Psophocarpus tetragonolobus]|uniref:Uncharacterized protein n=1 Tax=Psophocarpus tetragonolobus TaxID=3891 RepID=A0AAN9SRQ4_PSOTE
MMKNRVCTCDSAVKIWDSRKLEKDISFRSKLTYHWEGSRVLCVAMLPGSAKVIIGASDGFIHMFSVDHISRGLGNVVEKYFGIAEITKKDIKEAWGDTRSNSNTWTLKASHEEGYASSLALGLVMLLCLQFLGTLIYVATGCNEVSLWNAENTSCHQVLRMANYDSDAEIPDLPWALSRPSTKPTSHSDLR